MASFCVMSVLLSQSGWMFWMQKWMKFNGPHSTVIPSPAMTFTFDLLKQKPSQYVSWPSYVTTFLLKSSPILTEILYSLVFSCHRLLWPWPLSAKSNKHICGQNWVKLPSLIFNGTWLRYVRVFAVIIPPVCLSSVRLVHPTQGVEPFGNISSTLCTLAILWPPCKILWRLSQRNLSITGIKCKRDSKMQQFWTYRSLYLINNTRRTYSFY